MARDFSNPKGTNFRCYLKLAKDFEMIEEKNEKKYSLTLHGKEYIENFTPYIDSGMKLSSIDLSCEQKKTILKVLTNGNWTSHKINIYWFMRFIEVTDGKWLPNSKEIEKEKLELANGLFGVSYKERTMSEFLRFACNWCIELGLVERIKTGTPYDRVFLTPLGVEVNNIFSLDLILKKSRLNLNFIEIG